MLSKKPYHSVLRNTPGQNQRTTHETRGPPGKPPSQGARKPGAASTNGKTEQHDVSWECCFELPANTSEATR